MRAGASPFKIRFHWARHKHHSVSFVSTSWIREVSIAHESHDPKAYLTLSVALKYQLDELVETSFKILLAHRQNPMVEYNSLRTTAARSGRLAQG